MVSEAMRETLAQERLTARRQRLLRGFITSRSRNWAAAANALTVAGAAGLLFATAGFLGGGGPIVWAVLGVAMGALLGAVALNLGAHAHERDYRSALAAQFAAAAAEADAARRAARPTPPPAPAAVPLPVPVTPVTPSRTVLSERRPDIPTTTPTLTPQPAHQH